MIKKLIFTTLIPLMFNSCIMEDRKECPNLSKLNKTEQDFKEAKRIEEDLYKYLNKSTIGIYTDVLKNYNNTENPNLYMNIESVQIFGEDDIWSRLIRNKNDDVKYKRILSSINKENKNWCSAKNRVKI